MLSCDVARLTGPEADWLPVMPEPFFVGPIVQTAGSISMYAKELGL